MKQAGQTYLSTARFHDYFLEVMHICQSSNFFAWRIWVYDDPELKNGPRQCLAQAHKIESIEIGKELVEIYVRALLERGM